MDTRDAILQARQVLIGSQRMLGILGLRLKLVEDTGAPTMWTDGISIGYSPAFVAETLAAEVRGTVLHEILHCALLHPFRRRGRESMLWNMACDYVVNAIVRKCGERLPKGALYDDRFEGMTAEQVYDVLLAEREEKRQQEEQGAGTPDENDGDDADNQDESNRHPYPPEENDADGSDDASNGNDGSGPESTTGTNKPGQETKRWEVAGEVRDAPREESAEKETEWKQAVALTAMQCEKHGALPGGMKREVERIKVPACQDLVAALLEMVETARNDFSWARPDLRYARHGLYMPTLRSEEIPPIVAAVDTSGSINARLLGEFVGALQAVLDSVRPRELTVISCDTAIGKVAEYRPGERISAEDYPGGGGTDFRPVFEYVREKGIEPRALVFFTDLEGDFPERAPDYPVIWVVADAYGARKRAPWGETIWIE